MLTNPFLDRIVYTCRSGLAAGMRRQGGIDFLPRALSPEETFIQARDYDGSVVYDIGAYHGVHALHFSQTADHVYSFEPNPHSARRLARNLSLNAVENVTLCEYAIGEAKGRATQRFTRGNLPMASLDEAFQSADNARTLESAEVQVNTIDALVESESIEPPGFVKIDVEGYEESVLEGMRATLRTHRPDVFIELHGPGVELLQARARRLLKTLTDTGYGVHHVESGIDLDESTIEQCRGGHLYGSICPG